MTPIIFVYESLIHIANNFM